jgi:hypothetical protein
MSCSGAQRVLTRDEARRIAAKRPHARDLREIKEGSGVGRGSFDIAQCLSDNLQIVKGHQ